MRNIREDLYIEQLKSISSKVNVKIYLVGGAVRDIILNRQTNDYDFVVFGNIDKLAHEIVSAFLCKYICYKKGIKTYRIFCRLRTIDLSLPRGKTIEEDLKERDFTINSIALDLDNFEFIDPLGGIYDIEKEIIKVNSKNSILNDPIRILRGFRFATLFRFDIDPYTINYFKENVNLLKNVSKERITEELKQFFTLNDTFVYLLIMDKVGVIDALFEDLALMNGCIQSVRHLFDVKTHSLNVYNYIEWAYNRLEKILGKTYKKYLVHYTLNKDTLLVALKLAALFHDAGKPFSKIVVDGKAKFPEHEKESLHLFERYAKTYHFGKKVTKLTKFFIENHIEPANLYKCWSLGELNDVTKVDFFLKYKETGIDLLFFALADTLAKGKISASKKEFYIMFLREMAQYYYSFVEPRLQHKPLIEANEILSLYPQLPKTKLKHILFNLKKLQIAEAITSKEKALVALKHMV